MSKEKESEMTREEFEKYKIDTMESIDLQLPLLQKQIQYQKFVTEMEELRARYMVAMQTIANIAAPAPQKPEPVMKQEKRELKKEPVE